MVFGVFPVERRKRNNRFIFDELEGPALIIFNQIITSGDFLQTFPSTTNNTYLRLHEALIIAITEALPISWGIDEVKIIS
jgi:hypothetical protein